jgi:hypothetical protein
VPANSQWIWIAACVGLAAGACGGEAPAPPQQPASELAAAEEGTPEAAGTQVEPQEQESAPELVREVFSYRGAGRDPFISLLRSGDVRPLMEDLRVTSITYNPRYPSASVAVLRDTTVNKRYTVRVGDEVGRLRIAEIRQHEVLVIIEEFGVEQQRTLRLRRRQEG